MSKKYNNKKRNRYWQEKKLKNDETAKKIAKAI
jgi:hypothetical protein